MVVSALATLKNGSNQHKVNAEGPPNGGGGLSTADAAKLLQASPRNVERAKQIRTNGCREVVKAVDSGELNLNQATKLVKAGGSRDLGSR